MNIYICEADSENDNSTIAIKSEASEKEKHEINLTSLGFLLPENTDNFSTPLSYLNLPVFSGSRNPRDVKLISCFSFSLDSLFIAHNIRY